MKKFTSVFSGIKPVIGMVHLKALPGTPKNTLNSSEIINAALLEADIYKRAGINAIMLENMHDVPYLNGSVGHEISTLMTLIGHLIKQRTNVHVGIQILAGANMEALAAAKAAGLDFIRVEGFVFAHVADEGIIEAQAAKLLRYRKKIGAEDVAIFTDIKKKHSSHAITEDVSLLDTAKAAQFFLSDGVIVTGSHTGISASIEELKTLKDMAIPVLIGSGITKDNIADYWSLCNGIIIGSHFKKEGYWENELDYNRVSAFMKLVRSF
ncbi:BtpA/SgcQ family protein [Sediminicola arcticus]|uniref:BtpA/SgcQ family protein n=1 Tax=Sediminicola arcticus TaxID=1574308 RepID=A0ABV2SU52_9FLAO